MTKLDRDLLGILDELLSELQQAVAQILALMVSEELTEDQRARELATLIGMNKPKTYTEYISDIKQVFREAGWKEPTL